MSTIYEVTINGGSRVESIKGEHMFVDSGFLIIEDDKGASVAIFAQFDEVIARPQEKTE